MLVFVGHMDSSRYILGLFYSMKRKYLQSYVHSATPFTQSINQNLQHSCLMSPPINIEHLNEKTAFEYLPIETNTTKQVYNPRTRDLDNPKSIVNVQKVIFHGGTLQMCYTCTTNPSLPMRATATPPSKAPPCDTLKLAVPPRIESSSTLQAKQKDRVEYLCKMI